MSKENLGNALSELKDLLRTGADVAQSVKHVCDKHLVVELPLRRWFEKITEKTPEEYRKVVRHIGTIDDAIAAATKQWLKDPFGPNLVGRRFSIDYDDRLDPGKSIRRWYRYIGDQGHAIEAIDEETLKLMYFNGDPDIRREIKKSVQKAKPYTLAKRLQFWGTDDDLSARRSVMDIIRLVLWDTDTPDEVHRRIKGAPTLTLLYQSLTPAQCSELEYRARNPCVRVSITENGRTIDPLVERNLRVLRDLENDDEVSSPFHNN